MMNTTLSIRTATAADAEMLTELAWRAFYDAYALMNSPENMEAYRRRNFTLQIFSAQFADPRATFLIAEIEGTSAGYVKLLAGNGPDCVKGDSPVEIVRFYVDRQFHGGGVAHKLMQACLDHAKQSGHQTIYLGVWERNPRAIAFYRKWEFETVGSYMFQMGDEAQNDLWMERRLQEPAQ
jgi:ribosomal protein S18 acetylase RimI-like enzyme